MNYNSFFKFYWIFIILQWQCESLFSQNNSDTIRIGEVTITEKYTPDFTGLKILTIDSASLQNKISENISSILCSHTSISVKSYGTGGNVSTGFRGTGSNHTQFLWNGININSSMLGQADAGSIPNFLIDNISIYHGGAALSNNSGAFGGSINLMNKPDWNHPFSLDFMQIAGSYNTFGTFMKTTFGNKKLQWVTRIFQNDSENNFLYIKYDGGEDMKNNHAQYDNSGLTQEIYFKPDSQNTISAIVWMQKNFNNMPSVSASEHQKNECGRVLTEWTHLREKLRLTARSAYIQNEMNYVNNDLKIYSRNEEKIYSQNIDSKIKLNENFSIISGINMNITLIKTNNYNNISDRSQASFSSGVNGKILDNRLSFLLMIKKDFFDYEFSPVIPSLGLEFFLPQKKNLLLKSNFSKNYHYPSMNDLYWNPGGNPNLKPEEGSFAEAGTEYIFKSKNEKQKASFELTVFYSEIFNNIIWTPIENSSFWAAQNIRVMYSKGIEIHLEYFYSIGKSKLNLSGNYSYTSAINKKEITQNDHSAGKQIIYVPYNIFNVNTRLSRDKIFVNYLYTFTGIRYIYSDNSWYMPPYMLSDISIGTFFKFNNYTATIQGSLSNLFNVDYQTSAGYPMMRRGIKITVKLSL